MPHAMRTRFTPGDGARLAHQVDRRAVVGAEQDADLRVHAGQPPADRLDLGPRAAHLVHVRGRPAEIADRPLEVRRRGDRLDLARGSTRRLRLWMTRPSCIVMLQKVQPPKQPRMISTESLIVSKAGISLVVPRVRAARERQVVDRVHPRLVERQAGRVDDGLRSPCACTRRRALSGLVSGGSMRVIFAKASLSAATSSNDGSSSVCRLAKARTPAARAAPPSSRAGTRRRAGRAGRGRSRRHAGARRSATIVSSPMPKTRRSAFDGTSIDGRTVSDQ